MKIFYIKHTILDKYAFLHNVFLITCFQERFLCEEGLPPLDPTVCISIVEVIRALMSAPPDFAHIHAIYDYLILAHPASDTHISLGRPSFYFVLSSITSTSPIKTVNDSIKSSSTCSESGRYICSSLNSSLSYE